MSNLEVMTGKIGDPQSGADNRLEKSPSPGRVKAGKPKRSGKRKRAQARKSSRPTKSTRPTRVGSKQDLVIEMLHRKAGASIETIMAKTKWQSHSVRGFFSGIVRKKFKLPLVSDVGKDGVHRYYIASVAASKS